MSTLLGVDAGGTKAAVRLYQDGVSRDTILPSTSWSNQDREALRTLAGQLTRMHRGVDIDAVVIGASGCETAQEAHALRDQLQPFWRGTRLRIVNDAHLVLPAAGHDCGVALIAGTGSIALGVGLGGTVRRVGGWGPLLGDDGSAYATVRHAARLVLAANDAHVRPGPLARRLQDAFEVRDSLELVRAMHEEAEPRQWASLAGLVVGAADEGDPLAREALSATCRHLASLAVKAAEADPSDGPVVLAGGLFTHQPRILVDTRERLERLLPDREITALTVPPVAGAIVLAARLLKSEGSRSGRSPRSPESTPPTSVSPPPAVSWPPSHP